MGDKVRAIGMTSGGLDSTLALAVMQRQGIEVIPISFLTGFGVTEVHRGTGWRGKDGTIPQNEAQTSSAQLGLDVELVDIFGPEYLRMLLSPRHGYGKYFNPCIDCHAFMLRRCGQLMQERGARFVFTGEVLGQRPKSQRLKPLQIVEQDAGLPGLVLRPLSAQRLAPSIPEREGWVDRAQLHNISGRSRASQLALAHELGLQHWPSPAGGCFLTEENFARKLRDLVDHHPHPEQMTRDEVFLLALGRHFRLADNAAFSVGRDHAENQALERLAGDRWVLAVQDHVGPSTLVRGEPAAEQLRRIAAITAGYGKGRDAQQVQVACVRGAHSEVITVAPERGAAQDTLRI